MLLPNKIQINKAKAQETKRQIDEGVGIARKVDALRELKLEQERNIKQWRDTTVRVVQNEINEWIQKKDMFIAEAKVAERRRDEALKPLNEEKIRIREESEQLVKDKNEYFLKQELFNKEVKELEQEKERINIAISKAESNEKDTEKLNKEAKALKEVAERESHLARQERDNSNKILERKISEVTQTEKEYKVAFNTIEIRENQVKDKEEELITRENDLARRIKNLQRVEGLK